MSTLIDVNAVIYFILRTLIFSSNECYQMSAVV